MSDTVYIGRATHELNVSPKHKPYLGVEIWTSDNGKVSAGDRSGEVLVVEQPYGTKDMAWDILNEVRGFSYQPFEASGTILDPAVELGDDISVGEARSSIYQMDVDMGPLYQARVSAPDSESINHEIRVMSKSERHFRQEMQSVRTEISQVGNEIKLESEARTEDSRELRSQIDLTAEKITAEVSNRESDVSSLRSSISIVDSAIRAEASARKSDIETLRSEFSVTPDSISAKVDKSGGSYSSFGWNLTSTYWELRSNGATVLKVDKDGAELRGKITAESGSIGGFDIKSRCLSTNGATWNSENNYGVYIGPEGIKLGNKFKVDNAGNIVAGSAAFVGTVSAKNILIGGEHGYMDGKGILAESIGGWEGREIIRGGIDTFATHKWINGSLGNGNWAADCCRGIQKFNSLSGYDVYSSYIRAEQFIQVFQGGKEIYIRPEKIEYVGADGDIWWTNVMTWVT